ncbi:MAG: ABC transporter permease [Bacteroidetes bacterium]|nr:ABC transporter permease [Bacteroidota bacterium]
MFINYLKIAIRSLLRSKFISFINIFGLSLGIACAILIILFVKNELTYDTFHINADRIYRPWTKEKQRGKEFVNTATPFSMGKQLYESYEEVEKYTVFTSFNDLVKKGDKSFNENITIAGSHFFEMFDFDVVNGNSAGVLTDPGDVVITRKIAEKYFGSTDAAGSNLAININGQPREFEVRAVVENVPSNSSIRFELIVSDHYLKDIFPEQMLTSWFMINGQNFIMLREGADPLTVSAKFVSLVKQVLGERLEEREYAIFLQPLKDIHLNADLPPGGVQVGDPKTIFILGAIAILILVIASINFVTLSLGRSMERSKEIGIRKTVGAYKGQLVRQFIGEAVITSLIALLIGVFIAWLALPMFNEFSDKELAFELTGENIGIFLLLSLLIGVLSGFYPALIMSGFNTVSILKGSIKMHTGGHSLRTVLITGQFVLSIFLISATLIMKNQLRFLQNKNLGFDKEHVVVLTPNVDDAKGWMEMVTKGMEKGDKMILALKSHTEIINTAMASHTFEPGTWTNIAWMEEDVQYSFYYNTISVDYLNTLAIKLVEGRDFNEGNQADYRRSFIVNESFVREFEIENPVGSMIPNGRFKDHEIIGVVEDFHIESLHAPIGPLVMALNVELGFSGSHNVNIGSNPSPKIFIRLAPDKTSEALGIIRTAWNEIYSGEPFDFDFLDENLKVQYLKEENLGKIMTSATALAVIISCLGLFGFSALILSARIKEISIRKVLGASRNNLIYILSGKFVVLIIIALLIAIPVTWYTMDNWLSGFEYRILITPFIFLLAGTIIIAISLIAISYQTFRVIRANPSDVLRTE